MKFPSLINAESFDELQNLKVLINDEWVIARPCGYYSIFTRFKYAWMVFTGKADALVWPENQ